MVKTLPHKLRRLLQATALLSLPTLAGCFGVAWLPDSSGFIYTDGNELQQLVHYDIASGQRRVLVAKLPAATAWPALSADGKQIAVARLVRDKNQPAKQIMQLILYDREGEEIHRSPEIVWTTTGKESNEELVLTNVYWAPSTGRLLVNDFEGDCGNTGIYDPVTKKMVATMEGIPAPFGGTPIRSDGKGFILACKRGNSPATLSFVDLDGKAQPIDMKPEAVDNDDKSNAVTFPWSASSQWNGNEAVVTYRMFRIRIDTAKRTGNIEKLAAEDAVVEGKEIVQQFAFPGGGKLRVLIEDQPSTKYTAEFVKGAKEVKAIKIQDKAFIMCPSPNQKWVVLRSMSDMRETYLVNGAGEVKEISAAP